MFRSSELNVLSLKEIFKEIARQVNSLHLSGFLVFMENQNIKCKCGSSDYRIEQRNIHQTAFCNSCGSYIKNVPQGKPITLFFGKYNGRTISSMIQSDEINYLKWLVTKPDLKPNSLKEAIESHLIGQ